MRTSRKRSVKHSLIGYAAIALALTAAHAWSTHTFGSLPFEVAATGKAHSVITPVSGSSLQVETDRRGMTASAFDGMEQPLMIENTECGSYAVSREINDVSRRRAMQLAI